MANKRIKSVLDLTPWRNLNAGVEDVDPHTLIFNAENFREHGEIQEKVWQEYIRITGFVGYITVHKETREVMDGHFRLMQALKTGQTTVPVAWIACDNETKRQILRRFDEIGELAIINRIRRDQLDQDLPKIGRYTAEIDEKIANLKTISEQMLDNANADGDLDGDFGFEDDFGGLGDEFNLSEEDVFGNGGVPKTKKRGKGVVKVVLRGEQVAKFRQILSEAGAAGQVADERSVLVIMGQ